MAAKKTTSTSALWSLYGTQSQPSSTSSESDHDLSEEYTVVRDHELGVNALFLRVGREPARSKRTGEVYDKPVVGVRRNKDKMEITLENGKKVSLPTEDADIEALREQFPDTENFTIDDLAFQFQPQFQSTPIPQEPRRKKQKLTRGPTQDSDSQGKFKGVVEVPLRTLKRASREFTLVQSSHCRVEAFKAALKANKGIQLPLLPVLVEGSWDQENAEESSYVLLGGYSLFEALLDLSNDDRRVLVQVHEGLTPTEALQVGALFQQEQSLLIDDIPTLQAKVNVCRRLLYAMHDIDETEEPPNNVKLEWRPRAAASLGIVTSSRKELKPLETTFQLALYSKRCHEKLIRLFRWYEDQYGKAMKTSMFLCLQGLTEVDKFDVLCKLVNGTLKVEEVKVEATRLKRLSTIKHIFKELTKKATWEECCEEFPAHTQTAALDYFMSMNFKKAVPMEFIEYIRDAENGAKNGSSSFEHLRMAPVSLIVLEVKSKESGTLKRVLENLKNGSKHVAVMAEGLQVAAKWQTEMRRQGFSLLHEAAIIKETRVCHLIIGAGEEGSRLSRSDIPMILQEKQAFQTLIEQLTDHGDEISMAEEMQELSSIARSLGRRARVMGRKGETSKVVDATLEDSDETDIE